MSSNEYVRMVVHTRTKSAALSVLNEFDADLFGEFYRDDLMVEFDESDRFPGAHKVTVTGFVSWGAAQFLCATRYDHKTETSGPHPAALAFTKLTERCRVNTSRREVLTVELSNRAEFDETFTDADQLVEYLDVIVHDDFDAVEDDPYVMIYTPDGDYDVTLLPHSGNRAISYSELARHAQLAVDEMGADDPGRLRAFVQRLAAIDPDLAAALAPLAPLD